MTDKRFNMLANENIKVKIDETVITSVTDIGHVVKHVKMMRKVKEHILAVRKKERKLSNERYYKKKGM